MGTRRKCNCLFPAIFFLLLMSHQNSSSPLPSQALNLCSNYTKSIAVAIDEPFYFQKGTRSLTLGVSSDVCKIEKGEFKIDFSRPSSNGSMPLVFKNSSGTEWYRVTLHYLAHNISTHSVILQVDGRLGIKTLKENNFLMSKSVCPRPVFNVNLSKKMRVAKICSGRDYHTGKDGNRKSPHRRRHYILFIPIGGLIFLASVFLRCFFGKTLCYQSLAKHIGRRRRDTVIVSRETPSSSYPAEHPVYAAPPYFASDSSCTLQAGVTDFHPSGTGSNTESLGSAIEAAPAGVAEGSTSESNKKTGISRVLESGSRAVKSQFEFKRMK